MKKIIFLSLVFALTAMFCNNAKASGYTADERLVDEMFAKAPEAVNPFLTDFTSSAISTAAMASGSKDAAVALILDFFLGGFGIHRFYLGTEVMTGIGYILTCGGIFGIVPIVDFIELIINYNDISRYVDNPKFFMWN